MTLNENKTECIRRMNGFQSLTVNSKTIDVANKAKDLRVIIDKHLTFNDQINEIVRLPSFNLWNIPFIRKYLRPQNEGTKLSCTQNR